MLPKYFIAEAPALPGALFIISTSLPFYIGQVYRYKSAKEFEEKKYSLEQADKFYDTIDGYYVLVAESGWLAEKESCSAEDLCNEVYEMADFFLTTRIARDKAYWKRYLDKGAP